MSRGDRKDADMEDLPSSPRDAATDKAGDITCFARSKSCGPFPIQIRDSLIKCTCPTGTIRLSKDIVLAGTHDGTLIWMHLPCKPYLPDMSAEMIAKISSLISSAGYKMEAGDPDELQRTVLGTLRPSATAEEKIRIKHFMFTYRCDGPCRGSLEITDYFCCKKCCAWQHKPCMLFDEEQDRGAPVCNHCYMNFLVHRDEFVAWQKKRLAQAGLEALKFIKNPRNELDPARLAFCRRFVAGFLHKNRAIFVKFVIARRRVEQLVRISRNARKNMSDAANRATTSSEQDIYSASRFSSTVEAHLSDRAQNVKAKGKSVKEEPMLANEKDDEPMQSDRGRSINVAQPSSEEEDSDNVIVKPGRVKTKFGGVIRKPNAPKKKDVAHPSATPKSKAKSTPKENSNRPIFDKSGDGSPQLPTSLKKKWQFSKGQKSLPARKTARSTRQPPAEDNEGGLENGDDTELDQNPRKTPAARREAKKLARSALDLEIARRILADSGPKRPGQNKHEEKEESWVDDEQPQLHRRAVNEEEGDCDDGPAISCRCASSTPSYEDSFKCGGCGRWQHLACSLRTASVLPECNFCSTRTRGSEAAKATKASQASSSRPAKAKPKRSSASSKAHPKHAQEEPEQPALEQRPAQTASRQALAKQKASATRKPQPTSAPRTESNPAPIIAPKSAAAIPRTPLTPEMKDEVQQLCSTILWRTYCEIPTLSDSDGDDINSEEGNAHPPTPPANWLIETQARLTEMLEVFGPEQTQAYLSPVLSTFPRRKDNIIKTLREMAVEIVHRGAYKRQGKKALGVLAEVLALEDKGRLWKG